MLGASCYIRTHHCFSTVCPELKHVLSFNSLSLFLVHSLVVVVTDLYQVSGSVCVPVCTAVEGADI